MSRKDFDVKTIQELYNQGIITQDNVSGERLEKIIRGIEGGSFKVWSDPEFDPKEEPIENSGVSICYECGKMYWVTPSEDAYKDEDEEGIGKVCEPCLVRSMTGRDKVDIIIPPENKIPDGNSKIGDENGFG